MFLHNRLGYLLFVPIWEYSIWHTLYQPVSSMKKIHYFGDDVIKKYAPRDYRLSSRDAKRWPLGQIFLSHPHTHDTNISGL